MTEQTNTYKGFKILPLGTFSVFEIKPMGSGTVPMPLRGHYTNRREAQMAVDRELDKVLTKKGRKTNAKEDSTASSK